jgi:hypothetical protein
LEHHGWNKNKRGLDKKNDTHSVEPEGCPELATPNKIGEANGKEDETYDRNQVA